MSIPATLPGFDWASLDPETRTVVQVTTARLHELERRTGEAIIEIGRGLSDTKQRLGHGKFGTWIESEFGWTQQTAGNFMRVAEVFGQNEKLFQNASPSALYALASGNVPKPIRDEFIARAEAGEIIRHQDVKQRLAVVDLDSGEIIEPGEAEPAPTFEPYVPPRYQTASVSLLPQDQARAFSDGLIAAQAPHIVAQAMADANAKARTALRRLSEFPPDVIAEHGDLQDVRDCVNDILSVAAQMTATATAIRDRLRAGERLRAVK